MDFFLNSILNIFNLSFKDSGGSLASVLSGCFILFYTLLPFILYFWIKKNAKQFENETFKRKFGDIFHGLNLKNEQATLFYFYFIIRRMIYCLTYYFLEDFLLLQMTILNIGTFTVLLYILKVKPYERKLLNQIELFNEGVILLLTYFCWVFSDNTIDINFKDDIGWLYIYILFLTIFINACFILYDQVLKPCFLSKIIFKRRLKLHIEKKRNEAYYKNSTNLTLQGLMDTK